MLADSRYRNKIASTCSTTNRTTTKIAGWERMMTVPKIIGYGLGYHTKNFQEITSYLEVNRQPQSKDRRNSVLTAN